MCVQLGKTEASGHSLLLQNIAFSCSVIYRFAEDVDCTKVVLPCHQ